MTKFAILFAAVSCLLVGCSSPAPAPAPATPATQQSFVANSSATGLGSGSEAVSDEKLAKLKSAYETAKKGYAAKKTDATVTDAYIVATVSYGSATMYAANLDAKQKYRGALALYREALAVQPTGDEAKKFSAEALDNKALIERIYKSMNMAVPQ